MLTPLQREVLVRRLRGETFTVIGKDKHVAGVRIQQIYKKAKIELLKQLGESGEIGRQ